MADLPALTPKQLRLQSLWAAGFTQGEIADAFGVTVNSIAGMVKRLRVAGHEMKARTVPPGLRRPDQRPPNPTPRLAPEPAPEPPPAPEPEPEPVAVQPPRGFSRHGRRLGRPPAPKEPHAEPPATLLEEARALFAEPRPATLPARLLSLQPEAWQSRPVAPFERSRGCQWPLWHHERPGLHPPFCEAPRIGGLFSPYCETHKALAWQRRPRQGAVAAGGASVKPRGLPDSDAVAAEPEPAAELAASS